ncbi:ATP-binding protein [Streptomyces sp. NPDC018031]|uniref:ATP-binding protein n=1 Tax=Streptomyces sp. NPDC018031 TaxID=3365033 RepID=UPI0037B6F1A4
MEHARHPDPDLEEPWAYTLHLPHDPRSSGVARSTLRAVLAGHGLGTYTETATLLTSEMVANAFLHSDGPARLRIRCLEEKRLRVCVMDTNPDIPPPFDAPPGPGEQAGAFLEARRRCLDLGGRGLLLVRYWADNWGGYPLAESLWGMHGKLLWFELTPDGSAFAPAA